MGKVFQISIYSLLLILVFLFFGTILKSCGSNAVDSVTDAAQEATDNIKKAGGEVVAKAESALENVAEEFEGDDINFADTKSENKTYSKEKVDDTAEEEDDSPSYVQEDAPVYNPPEDVVTKKVEEKKPAKKAPTSTASSGSGGNYLLITGNYSQEPNANAMVKRLKGMGFSRAEKVIFEGSKYYTVIAGKYSSMSTANSAKGDLGGIDAYVQKKRL